jgi:hypothetical protein
MPADYNEILGKTADPARRVCARPRVLPETSDRNLRATGAAQALIASALLCCSCHIAA